MNALMIAGRLIRAGAAREEERAAEACARARLLALARDQGWPEVVVHTADGWELVAPTRCRWEQRTEEWRPAGVAVVVQILRRRAAAECKAAPISR